MIVILWLIINILKQIYKAFILPKSQPEILGSSVEEMTK